MVGSAGTTSTAGSDTFNVTNLTLNSFDNINGGTGTTDTLNVAWTAAAAFAVPASTTIAGFEIVNVSNSGTAGTNAVAVTNTTFGTGVQKLNWAEAGAGSTSTAAVTLASATDVSLVSTATAWTTVAVTDTSTTTASTGSTLKTITINNATGAGTLTGNGITTLNVATRGGVDTITAAAGTRDLTVNTSGTGAITGVTDAQATSLTLNNTGAQALGTFTTAKATVVNVNTTAAATGLVVTAAAATTLNIGGTSTVAAVITGSTALTTINISGAGAGLTSVVDLSGIATGLTAITSTATSATATAAGNTLGATTATQGFGTGVAFTGGAGNDTITVGATTKAINVGGGTNTVFLLSGTTALGTGGSITATTGTTDTLSLVNADAVSLTVAATGAAFKALVTGFEIVDVNTATGTTISMTAFGSFNELAVTPAAVTQVISGMTTGKTLTLNTTAAAFTSLTTNNLSGAADTMTVKLKGALSTALVAYGTVTIPGVELLTINVVDSVSTFAGTLSTLTVVDTSATSIVLTGNNGVALTFAGVALNNFDASGLTRGAVTFTAGAQTTDVAVKGSALGGDTLNFASATSVITMTATAGTNALTGSATIGSTITGGTGADTITGGSGVDTISGGVGNDIISAGTGNDIMTGGAGVDAFQWSNAAAAANHSAIGGFDTITDFQVGTDTLSFTGVTDIVSVQQAAVQTAVTALAAGSTAAQIATAMSAANTTNLGVAFATFGGDTYVLFETAGGTATFVVADDIFIKLSGVTTIPTYANSVV